MTSGKSTQDFQIPYGQEAFEKDALVFLVNQCTNEAELLEEQIRFARRERRMTGVGFYLDFNVPTSCSRLPKRRPFAKANFEADELQHGGGLLLWTTDDGFLDSLEGYCFGEDWPTIKLTLKRVFKD